MTNQPIAIQDKITPAELRQQFDDLHAEIDSIRHDLETLINAVGTITAGLQHAATATPPTQSGQFKEMMIDNILMNYDKAGKKTYTASGAPYSKYGVRVWDEVIPMLGIDPTSLNAGPNPQNPPIRARVLLHEYTDEKTGEPKIAAQKVIGKA